MARIRTIKPEFWTDEKIVQLPYEARLAFIGLWNFADDEGRLIDEPSRLKLELLPNDPVDMEVLLDLLVAAELVDRYQLADGSFSIVIRHFGDHQRVSHKAPSRISLEGARKIAVSPEVRRAVARKYGCEPGGQAVCECYYCGSPGRIMWHKKSDGQPSYWVSVGGVEFDHFVSEANGGETSNNNIVLACRKCNRSKGTVGGIEFILLRRNTGLFENTLEDNRIAPENTRALRPESKGRESRGREGTPLPPQQKNGFDLDGALDAFNIIAKRSGLAVAGKLTDKRRTHLRARLDEVGMEGWERALTKLGASSFLKGLTGKRDWRADFDFILQPSSFTKLIEGAYDDKRSNGDELPQPRRPRGPPNPEDLRDD